MPLLNIFVDGNNSCKSAEELAEVLLQNGLTKGEMRLVCYGETATLQISDIPSAAIEQLAKKSQEWASSNGLNSVREEGLWKKISLANRKGQLDKATIVHIMP